MNVVRYGVAAALLLAYSLPGRAYEYARFDVVGDSISDGFNRDTFPAHYGWVHMLFGEGGGGLPEPKTNTIYTLWPGIAASNSAVSGSKASQWADPTTPPYLADVLSNHPDLVVVFIGGNDLIAYVDDGPLTLQEQEEFRTNLMTIVAALLSNAPTPTIILANYYDLFDTRSAGLPASLSNYWPVSDSSVEMNEVIEEVAEKHSCYYVDDYSNFMYHCYGYYVGGEAEHLDPFYVNTPLDWLNFDIHPVTDGYDELYELFYDKLSFLKAVPEPSLCLLGLIGPAVWIVRSRMYRHRGRGTH